MSIVPTGSQLTASDAAKIVRLDRLMRDRDLRERLGGHALGGPSAILAAGAWLRHGDDPQSENSATAAARGVGPSVVDVVGRAGDGQVHHDETQPAQPALVDGAASPVDGAHDDRDRLGGVRGGVAGVAVGDEE